jgi:LCP family protein required for cell wall assembly
LAKLLKEEPDLFGQQIKEKKRGRFWRWLGATVLLLVVGGGAYATLTPHGRETVHLFRQAVPTMIAVQQNPDLLFEKAGSNQVNILLIGRDVNWKPALVWDPVTKTKRPYHVHDNETKARSDTMIIMSLDKIHNRIRMISVPRDSIVYIPDHDVEKINAAHSYGGPQLLMRTLHDELGITIHHYAVIQFDGFKNLIDQVGGVTVNVDGALKRDRRTGKLYRGNLDYDDNWGNLHIHLKPGMQKLNGEQAHSYVRFRMDLEGDPGRIRRQQQVMRALAKSIMQAPPYRIPGLVQEVRRKFETSLGDQEIGSAAYFTKRIGDTAKIQPLTLFGVYYRKGSIKLNKPKNEALLGTIFGSTFNPDNFLQRSPYTSRGDDIGSVNNSSKEAQAVLREAGLLEDAKAPRATELDVPVRVEPSKEGEEGREGSDGVTSTGSRRSRRIHIADSSSDTSSGSITSDSGERPRRRRRVSRRIEETSVTTTRENTSSPNGSESSPVPAPEDSATAPESSTANSGDSQSPVPQPE